jgi:hypothetical protein
MLFLGTTASSIEQQSAPIQVFTNNFHSFQNFQTGYYASVSDI